MRRAEKNCSVAPERDGRIRRASCASETAHGKDPVVAPGGGGRPGDATGDRVTAGRVSSVSVRRASRPRPVAHYTYVRERYYDTPRVARAFIALLNCARRDAVESVRRRGRFRGGARAQARARAEHDGTGGVDAAGGGRHAAGQPSAAAAALLLSAALIRRPSEEIAEHDRVRAGAVFGARSRDRRQTR